MRHDQATQPLGFSTAGGSSIQDQGGVRLANDPTAKSAAIGRELRDFFLPRDADPSRAQLPNGDLGPPIERCGKTRPV